MFQVTKEIRELFEQKIAGLLVSGEAINTVKNSTKTRDIYEFDNDGIKILVGQVDERDETKQVSLKPTPTWVMNMIDKSMSTQAAIDLLVSQGYLVIDPTNKPENKDKTKTLTDATINQLKARILGLKNRGTN